MKKYILYFIVFTAFNIHAFAQKYHVNEDFNNGVLPTDWENNALSGSDVWGFGIDGSSATHSGNQNLDGTSMAFFDDDALGQTATNNTAELITPYFDNSNDSTTYLEFDYNFRRYSTNSNDSFYVEVYDGSNWNLVFSRTQNDCGNYEQANQCWYTPHAFINISAYASDSARVRFVYHDGDAWAWYAGLDNVEIYSIFPVDLKVSSLVRPADGCSFGGTDSVEVAIANLGQDTVTSFSVSYSVDGGTVITENVNKIIPAFDTITHLFNTTTNMASVATYQVKAYVTNSLDGDHENDTLNTVVVHEPAYTPTYFESFENSAGGWKTYGQNSSWELGVPSGTDINIAAVGSKAFVTNLSGVYDNDQMSYLESPCFDFSASPGDPLMSFSLALLTERNYDYLWMEYTLDNGVSWQKLPAGGPNPQNWYNNRRDQRWEGQEQGWLNVENVLVGLGGEPQVKFRFAFYTDGGGRFEGIGVDGFSIRDPQPVDLAVTELSYPAPGGAPLCGYGPSEGVILQIENKGQNRVNSFEVGYIVDGSTAYLDTMNIFIDPGTYRSFVHSRPVNLSTLKNYQFTVWVRALGDGFTPNDTLYNLLVSNTRNVIAPTIPYSQNFEAFNEVSVNGQYGWIADPISINTASRGWRINSGGTVTGGTGPAGDHTSGSGRYSYLEADGSGPIAYMASPCLDLSLAEAARMTFWYHRYGSQMQPTEIDVYNGRTWVNIETLTDQPQNASADEWMEHDVSLNQFVGRRIKFRFRASNITSGAGDMAIDDIRIYQPVPKDVEMVGPVSPVPGCDLGEESTVTVEIRNVGAEDVFPDSMLVYYQVDDTKPVVDTFRGYLNAETSAMFTFDQKADLGIRGTEYNIKAWVELNDDKNQVNDTSFYYKVTNYTRSTPIYLETFEEARDASCQNFMGQVLPNGWTADYTRYAWHVQSSRCGHNDLVTPTANTGPSGDHTTGEGMFLYTDPTPSPYDTLVNVTTSVAQLTSPCLDLTKASDIALSFWYHRFGSQMGRLEVQLLIDSTQKWETIYTINGQNQNSAGQAWRNAVVNISQYSGQYSKIRFAGQNGGQRSNMAIDDIAIYEIQNYDVGIVGITEPSGDGCKLSDAANVTVSIKNFGSQTIPADSLILTYTNNNEQLATDTVSRTIIPGATISHTFSSKVDLSSSGMQRIVVNAMLPQDTIIYNNRYVKNIENLGFGLPYSFQDFERHSSADLRGWTASPTNQHHWRIWQHAGPLVAGDNMRGIPPNGPSGDHTFATDLSNGDGMYVLLKSDFTFDGGRPDAIFKSPDCDSIDFTQSRNGKPLLSFWYHMFGDFTGDLFIDVYNGTQWINGVSVIRGAQHNSPQDPWLEWQVQLDNFAHVKNGLIRFRADYIGPIGGGDMGIDDVLLMDREEYDISVKELRRPESRCEPTNLERVRVRVQNTGSEDIFIFEMSHQITFYPYDSLPITFPVVRESITTQIVPTAYYTFQFNERLDMTRPGKYVFKIWADFNGDRIPMNDTIISEVVNTSRPFPSCEDFSGLLAGDNANNYNGEQLGASYGIFPNFWRAQKDASMMYLWQTAIGMPAEGVGGPTNGHSSGENDTYMIAAGGMPGMRTYLESPCYNLTGTPAANLEFWYQAPSESHFLIIEGNAGGGFQLIDTLYGQSVRGWRRASFVLADFVGSYTTFRFTAYAHGGYIALDDICVVRPPRQQVRLKDITAPLDGRCYYSEEEPFRMLVQNVGLDQIDSLEVVLWIDQDEPKFPLGQYHHDTIKLKLNNTPFLPGNNLVLTFDTVDLNPQKPYYISLKVRLPMDDTTDNEIVNYIVRHNIPLQLPYVIDFEDPIDPLNLLEFSGGPWTAGIQRGFSGSELTGPAYDHTFQSAIGHYILFQEGGPPQPKQGDSAMLTSQCIDLSQATAPELQYWYHMFGFDMGDLQVLVNDDTGWEEVDVKKGQSHYRNADPWTISQVDLTDYAGKFVRFRFTSFRGASEVSEMGLDDIYLFDLPSKDAAPNGLCYPTDDIYSCYTDTQSVFVELRNNGSLDIDFTKESAIIEVIIFKNGRPWDSIGRVLTTNPYQVSGVNLPLPRDSSACVKMDQTFDMSDIDSTFTFEIRVKLNGDVIDVNDTTITSLVARREVGEIAFIEPDDTVCFNTPVRLELKNFFGRLKWQEKEHDANGNGIWYDGFSFPNDDSIYVRLLDTTSELKVRVCGVEETVPTKIDITKPYSGRALNSSQCHVTDMDVRVRFPYKGPGAYENIDSVFIYPSRTSDRDDWLKAGKPYVENGHLYFDYTFTKEHIDSTMANDTAHKNPIQYNLDVFVGTKSDSCWSPERTRLRATVNFPLNRPIADSSYKEVCQDTSLVLNAGTVAGRRFTYDWTIIYPDGTVGKESVQTLVLDAWKMEKDQIYKYVVEVTSDSGCVNDYFLPPGMGDTLFVKVTDSCVTSIENRELSEFFNIYPNPTNDVVFVEFRSFENKIGTVTLMGVDGKLIESHSNVNLRKQTTKFNLEGYSKGVYFIRIETDEGIVVRKIIKS